MGVETIASRAVISLYQLIQRYGKRHGLHRPREVGRRAAGRCASGGRAAGPLGRDPGGKGVNRFTAARLQPPDVENSRKMNMNLERPLEHARYHSDTAAANRTHRHVYYDVYTYRVCPRVE